jgi:serine phosphatase RsbU (regulator of sigma subunit)/DNA-binding response OmpR family regulator
MKQPLNLHPDTDLKSGIKILAVDDDSFMRKVLEDIFKDTYILYVCSTALDFFEKLSIFKPDVLLIDVVLPDGNGIDICRRIRSEKANDKIFILIVTSFEDSRSIEEAYDAGANDYIRKPFLPYEVISKVNQLAKTIQYQDKIESLYLFQKQTNKKLVMLNELIRENINKTDKSSLLESFFEIGEIIGSEFCEIILFPGETFEIKKMKIQDDFAPVGYTSIIRELESLGSEDVEVTIFSVKGKEEKTVYCIAGNIRYNKRVCGQVVFQRSGKFSENAKQLILLYLDFINLASDEIESRKHLYEEVRKERKEMNKVRSLQVLLLPDFREIEKYDIASTFIPMEEISGDFFDAFYASENHYIIVLCDVAGHGIASSYIGSSIRGLIRSVCSKDLPPKEVVALLNDNVVRNLSVTYYFSSLIFCSINLESDDLTIVSAGHPPCFYFDRTKGQYSAIDKTGPLLGLMENATFDEHRIHLRSGDCFFMYTDGISEAHGSNSPELYGENRVYEIFQDNTGKDSIEIIHSIIGNVYEFTGYDALYDDVTAICIKKRGQ